MQASPSPWYSLTIRARYQNQAGMLGRIASAIGSERGDISAVEIVETGGGYITRDITFNARDSAQGHHCVEAIRRINGVRIINVSDRVFLLHLGGKLEIKPRKSVQSSEDLMLTYMPGVSRIAQAIAEDPEKVFTLTIRRNMVGIVSDGSAVVGLGNVGPSAALPVMEGKAVLLKEFAGVDAFPLCLDTQDPEQIISTVKLVAPVFAAIDLEGIAEPYCFEVERRLQSELSIPVLHGDRHGRAVVVLAGLINSARLLRKPLESLRVVIAGARSARITTARLLLSLGMTQVVVSDMEGILHRDRPDLGPEKRWVAEHTNPENLSGSVRQALKGADVYVEFSGSFGVTVEDVRSMGSDPVVFALSNEDDDLIPSSLFGVARIIATSLSDMPNQISNVLFVPGFFKGLLDSRACGVTDSMMVAAGRTIADIVQPHELNEEHIVPTVFDKRVVPAVSRTVATEAESAGLDRRHPRPAHP